MNDYPYIRAWGKLMGSFKYYVDDQVELARSEDAPSTAIYRRSAVGGGLRLQADSSWATTHDITNLATIERLNRDLPDELKIEIPES